MDLLLADEFLRSVMMSNSNVLEFKTELPHLITREPSQEMFQVIMAAF